MTDERLVSIPGLRGACTSSEAVAAASRVARGLDPATEPWRIGTEDGCDGEGRSLRWEVRYDLSQRRAEAVITIGFTLDESTRTHGQGVASVRILPFPSQGSELARMAMDGEITGRRLRAVWRQQMREHQPLPPDFPDSSTVARAVAPEVVRAAHARITRWRGAVWAVETPGRTRHLRPDDLD